IKYILDLPGIDVNVMTHHSNNYIMWTASKGNLPVMKLLLDKGSKTDIINSHGQSLLMHAAMSGKADPELYDFCLQNGGDIKNDKDEIGRNVMLVAIAGLKDLSFLKYFTDRGLSINDVDQNGNGLFNYAVQSGNVQTIKSLVAMGVQYKINKLGENAFAHVGRGRGGKVTVELLEYLKSLKIDPKLTFANGQNLAHTISRLGLGDEFISFLDQNNIDKSKIDHDGNSVLNLAAPRSSASLLKYWINYGDINQINKNGQSPLYQAVASNTTEAVKLLVDSGAHVHWKDKDGNNLYHTLIQNYRSAKGSLERVAAIMDILQEAGLQHVKDGSLLHIALQKNDQNLLDFLIKKGEDINAKDKEGYTILHYAAMRAKDLTMVKYLIDKNANVQIKTELDESLSELIKENEALSAKKLTLDHINR
ncbi:MAG TPA: ankyrin repeat domain-containing protein, partial [Saprospiraceae bacterium]|nr:ankyrin repeat domain-containing protein [Saprospiraceae bacterium]